MLGVGGQGGHGLVKGQPGHPAAVLEQSGHAPIDAAHISQYIGPPLDKVFRTIVGFAVDSNNLLNDLVQNYRIHYNEVGYSQNVLFEGIPAALEAIRAYCQKIVHFDRLIEDLKMEMGE